MALIKETHLDAMPSRLWNIMQGYGFKDFSMLPSSGRGGGQLIIWKEEQFKFRDASIGLFSISCLLISQAEKSPFLITTVYGPSAVAAQGRLWSETKEARSRWPDVPWIIGGDFNLTLVDSDRPGGRGGRDPGSRAFWDWTNDLSLIDMGPLDVIYTWNGNNSRSRIDHFFISVEATSLFPAAFCRSRERPFSDHTPIVWEDGTRAAFKYSFRIAKSWMQEADFKDVVRASWSKEHIAPNATARLTLKISRLRFDLLSYRRALKAVTSSAWITAQEVVRSMDILEDSYPLSPEQMVERRNALITLHKLDAAIEADWHQKSRIKWLKEGDSNTPFFHQ